VSYPDGCANSFAERWAFAAWAKITPLKRGRILNRFLGILQGQTDELAAVITAEHGKLLSDAKGEIQRGMEVVEFATSIAQLLKGEIAEDVGPGIDCHSLRLSGTLNSLRFSRSLGPRQRIPPSPPAHRDVEKPNKTGHFPSHRIRTVENHGGDPGGNPWPAQAAIIAPPVEARILGRDRPLLCAESLEQRQRRTFSRLYCWTWFTAATTRLRRGARRGLLGQHVEVPSERAFGRSPSGRITEETTNECTTGLGRWTGIGFPSQHKAMKKIGKSDVIGQQGMSLIEGIVLSMGFMFYQTGGVEAGIDGFIELRDAETGEVGNPSTTANF
jgi:hypothetical protein